MEDKKYDALIFGAGPAGLAAALKLTEAGKKTLTLEKDTAVGGISKTITFKNCRFDLGGHRFFTKSKEVNQLWEETLGDDFITRNRLSRIYYKNTFFNYPIKITNALKGLGILESFLIFYDYMKVKIFPSKEEKNFEQWVSNRFGKRLFKHFFKAYTEKLWGIPCQEIQAEWAAQRIKGLSLISVIKNALLKNNQGEIKTLIDQFKYPKLGPGMMYEKIAENIEKAGGLILKNQEVIRIIHNESNVNKVVVRKPDGQIEEYRADHFLSSMPITSLIKRFSPEAPREIIEAAEKLTYRSFITISVILDSRDSLPDTWIYIHSPEVKMGRIQNFKAWSPFMVPDESKIALGLEYFCTEKDELWNSSDEDLIKLGLKELEQIGLGKAKDFVDGFVCRVPKAYPVYGPNYSSNIKLIRNYLDNFTNLQVIGRYGMFKYNNMDHSILTGIYAAKNILGEQNDIWSINTDQAYHEEKK